MISKRSLLVIAVTLALGAGASCGGKSSAGAVDYSVSAQKNYEKGLKELEDKDWIAASKYFSFIKSRFPYSKYAVLAEIRLADAEFGAGEYVDAIPTHELVGNASAAFKVGEAYYRQLPGDFWLLPPSYEKDQSSTEDAEDELRG